MTVVRWLLRNPLTLYLRFVLQAAINRYRYQDFRQGYMSRVQDCEIESHVRILPESVVSACRIGRYTYVSAESRINSADIGRFCSIGPGCRVGLGTHPGRDFVSTSPVFFSTARQCGSSFVSQDHFEESSRVTVGNDVWIGANVTVIDGIRIGHGAIVGAGAVVVAEVPDYAIVGGVPARLIRFRFSPSEIAWLLEFRWWNRDEAWLRQNHHLFHDIKRMLGRFNLAEKTAELAAAGGEYRR